MAHGLNHINWSAPWLAPYRDLGLALAQDVCAGCSVAQALNAGAAHVDQEKSALGRVDTDSEAIHSIAPSFVPQDDLPLGVAYEHFIFEQRRVPTRDGLHDFFNGLSWLHFPHTKARLNALQAQHIELDGVQSRRGAVRDALTLFDENAALLAAPPALWEALMAKDWHALFVTHRALWAQAQLVLFGHALLEKLVSPRKAITAHVLVLPFEATPGSVSLPAWDTRLAASLSAEWLRDKPYTPLPVLGVPQWWAANANAAFYNDPAVFRLPRAAL